MLDTTRYADRVRARVPLLPLSRSIGSLLSTATGVLDLPELGSQPRWLRLEPLRYRPIPASAAAACRDQHGALDASTNARHVVIISEDGMRPGADHAAERIAVAPASWRRTDLGPQPRRCPRTDAAVGVDVNLTIFKEGLSRSRTIFKAEPTASRRRPLEVQAAPHPAPWHGRCLSAARLLPGKVAKKQALHRAREKPVATFVYLRPRMKRPLAGWMSEDQNALPFDADARLGNEIYQALSSEPHPQRHAGHVSADHGRSPTTITWALLSDRNIPLDCQRGPV